MVIIADLSTAENLSVQSIKYFCKFYSKNKTNVMENTSQLIKTKNSTVLNLLSRIEKVASTDCSILLVGETGTGKEVFAEYIHRISNRCNHPLVKVSLSTLPPNLI